HVLGAEIHEGQDIRSLGRRHERGVLATDAVREAEVARDGQQHQNDCESRRAPFLPAQAGIHQLFRTMRLWPWVPAFTGTNGDGNDQWSALEYAGASSQVAEDIAKRRSRKCGRRVICPRANVDDRYCRAVSCQPIITPEWGVGGDSLRVV